MKKHYSFIIGFLISTIATLLTFGIGFALFNYLHRTAPNSIDLYRVMILITSFLLSVAISTFYARWRSGHTQPADSSMGLYFVGVALAIPFSLFAAMVVIGSLWGTY